MHNQKKLRRWLADRLRLAGRVTTALIIAVSFGGCGQSESEQDAWRAIAGQDVEAGGITYRTYLVGDTVLYVPREYPVQYSGPGNINVLTYWPGLVGVAEAASRGFESKVHVILQPTSRYPSDVDEERALSEFLAREKLGPGVYEEKLGLTIHRRPDGTPRLLRASNPNTPFGEPLRFNCSNANAIPPEELLCRTGYRLNDDLHLFYRFGGSLLGHWQELDLAVRQFALSLTYDPRYR